MLDASKAFDKVNLLLLFNKLRLKWMCPLLLRFIINMYIGQNMGVQWNDCICCFKWCQTWRCYDTVII